MLATPQKGNFSSAVAVESRVWVLEGSWAQCWREQSGLAKGELVKTVIL